MKEQEAIITFKVTKEFKDKLQKLAAEENRSVSNYIKTVLEKIMKDKK